MLLSLSIAGIFLSVVLLYYSARKYTSSIYLGIFFLLISLYAFVQFVLLYSKSVFLVSVIFINFGSLVYLTGPLLYWYFRSILTDDPSLRKKDLWHLLPMLLFLAGTLNYIIMPWQFKMEIAEKIVENPDNVGNFSGIMLYEMLPKQVVILSRPALILGYTCWSLVIFMRFLKDNRESKVLSHQKYMTKWLSMLLFFLFILSLSQLLLLNEAINLEETKIFFTLNILLVVSGVCLAGLMISPFFFPRILYGLPQLPGTFPVPDAISERTKNVHEDLRKSLPEFEADYLVGIHEKSDSCMAELQPYLQPDCNLAYFSKISKIPAHHLSYYFREIRKQTFNEYRNEWRVKHAKNLILQGRTRDLTLEGIGLLSGFSSRNTFFTAFKKAEGISPGVFVHNHLG